ncbi:MAG: type I DNA topoisomerase [Ruminococcaceae bacterium]|nr:type I DNA topoisomerase [Oscillospiraceae bacterium]
MSKKLVIVESPAKAKTIKKYLGSGYEVTASMGHVRDLPVSKIGVDTENDFEPAYINIKGKAPLINDLKKAAKDCDKIFLATDPDREGEAISWHLAYILGLKETEANRVTFNEITKNAVKEGIRNPRCLDKNLIDAQQARRVLDRLVGYKLSPFLWRKIKKGLSAGRVQSVATRLIVDREREIKDFIPEEFWSLTAKFQSTPKKFFTAKFFGDTKGKIELKTEAQTLKIIEALNGAEYCVDSIKKGTKQRQPAPPFITSTLQQEASRRFGYPSKKTMSIAQQLYEGVNIKGIGLTGLITYMRTDSLRISNEALAQAKAHILSTYGPKYYPSSTRIFKTKKGAQDAHEAIRPSDITLTPDKVKDSLTTEQLKLYKLIWERFLSSQMANAVYETLSIDIKAYDYIFKANDQKIKFNGFTALYEEKRDEEEEESFSKIPNLNEGDILNFKELIPEQKFTQPPSRYSEATLIKRLEEDGIGRPSTYAPTISTITERNYVKKEGKLLYPTSLGEVTTDLMTEHFPDIVNIEFTANMENDLDTIEDGQRPWKEVIREFYSPFAKTLENAEKKLEGEYIKIPDEVTDIPCDKCGKMMVIKQGRFGKFLACPGYPECKNTKPLVNETDGLCPKCSSKMLLKKSRAGKKYYACEKGKECGFMTWEVPLKEKCPKCGSSLYKPAFRGSKAHCLKEGCDFKK